MCFLTAALTSNKHQRSSSTKSKLEKIDQASEELLDPGYVKLTIKKESLVELQKLMAPAAAGGTENMTPDKITSVYMILCQSGILSTTVV